MDSAGSADGDEKFAVSERLVDAAHLQRHLAEPDDVRAQRTVGPTGRTEAFARQRLAPGADAATDQTARLQPLAVHVDEVPRPCPPVPVADVLCALTHLARPLRLQPRPRPGGRAEQPTHHNQSHPPFTYTNVHTLLGAVGDQNRRAT